MVNKKNIKQTYNGEIDDLFLVSALYICNPREYINILGNNDFSWIINIVRLQL